MSKKIFLDINIVIDVIDSKRKNHSLAQKMILKTIKGCRPPQKLD